MEVEPDGPNPIKLTAYKSNFQLLMLGRESVIHNRPAATRRDRASSWGRRRAEPHEFGHAPLGLRRLFGPNRACGNVPIRASAVILAACHPVINQQKRLTQWRTSSRRRSVS